jgi:beta-glucosidase
MCAYNAINGQPACANDFLLKDMRRGAWNFGGYVVSDCSAVRDIYEGHRFRPSQPEASAISLQTGMDNECITFGEVKGHDDYQPYVDAMKQGLLSQEDVDRALTRLFTARMKLGMFDPPSMVPYAQIDPAKLDSAEHRQLALKIAEGSMVLLKNDGVLPIKGAKRILVVGPLADQTDVLLGNYNGQPTHTVSVLEGMKKAFPDAKITYVPGTQFLSNTGEPVPASALRTEDGRPGLKAEYRTGDSQDPKAPIAETRTEGNVDVTGSRIPASVKGQGFGVRWTGTITAPETGDYRVGIQTTGFGGVTVNGKPLARTYGGTKMGRVHLEKGEPATIDVNYGYRSSGDPQARLIWHKIDDRPDPAAVRAARNADVVVAVVGITRGLEGEEMPVSEPGFQGGDRTRIDMPEPETALVKAVEATGKPLVVVMTSGSALAARWEKAHTDAILQAWYPGEEGGTAVANTLSGRNNPAGRLPVTFYQDVGQLPHFEDYSMKGRTYRYFTGKPLWAFGYGLSYTSFSYGKLNLPGGINAGEPLHASVDVTNSGKVSGDEVVQLYLSFPDKPGAPIRALRGFKRVHLEPGQTQSVTFDLSPRDLSMVTDRGDTVVPAGTYSVSVGGGQPGGELPTVTGSFAMTGDAKLPE